MSVCCLSSGKTCQFFFLTLKGFAGAVVIDSSLLHEECQHVTDDPLVLRPCGDLQGGAGRVGAEAAHDGMHAPASGTPEVVGGSREPTLLMKSQKELITFGLVLVLVLVCFLTQ